MVRASTYLAPVAMLAASVVAKEQQVDSAMEAKLYKSGLMHESLMSKKMAAWTEASAAGAFDQDQYPELHYTKCKGGVAEAIEGDERHTFRCRNADLVHFLSHEDLGAPYSHGSSSWGWTSDEGREFIAIGQFKGTAFVEIDNKGRMIYLGRLPQYDPVGSQWREIRSYKHYMVIGSEAEDHGVQIFDMKKLLDIDPDEPVTFDAKDDLAGHFNELLPLGRAHNVVINEELEYGVAVGAKPRNDSNCASGLNFFSLEDPTSPKSLGCAKGDGYVHDAQCMVYRGPDERYNGTDICYGYNEDSLTIYNVTDKANTTNIISKISYEGVAYTHQGWVNDPNWQRYIFMDDEYDEVERQGPGADGYPITYIWDIERLDSPKQVGLFKATNVGIDHNLYVNGNYIYQSNYAAGLRVYDISSVPKDPSGDSVCESAFFDIMPEDDHLPGGGNITFAGSWSSYSFLKNDVVFINTIERGAFTVKLTGKDCAK